MLLLDAVGCDRHGDKPSTASGLFNGYQSIESDVVAHHPTDS